MTAVATRAEPTAPGRSQRRVPAGVLVLAALAVVYVASRVWFAARFPYFLDEGTYGDFVDIVAASPRQAFVSLTIGREPLQIWSSVPLVELGLNPLTALRAVSVAAGLGLVGVAGLLGRRVGGDAVGVVAAALCVLLPFFVVHDGIGIMEALVTLVMASALLVQIEHARRPSLRWGAVLGVVFAAAVLTKENTKPALVLVPVSLLLFDWSREGRDRRLRTWFGGIGIALAAAAAAGLVMRLSSYWADLEEERATPFYTVRKWDDVVGDPFGSWGTAWLAYRPALVSYVTLPVLAAALAGLAFALRRRPRLGLVLLAWLLLPALISLTFAGLPYARHIMYLTPPIVVLAAFGFVEATRWAATRLPRRGVLAAAAVVAVLALVPALVLDARVLADPNAARYPGSDDLQYVTGSGGGAAWPAVADVLRERARERPVVVLTPGADRHVLELMLRDDERVTFVAGGDPRAPRAGFAVMDDFPFGDGAAKAIFDRGRFTSVGRFQRPRGGATVELFERAARD